MWTRTTRKSCRSSSFPTSSRPRKRRPTSRWNRSEASATIRAALGPPFLFLGRWCCAVGVDVRALLRWPDDGEGRAALRRRGAILPVKFLESEALAVPLIAAFGAASLLVAALAQRGEHAGACVELRHAGLVAGEPAGRVI